MHDSVKLAVVGGTGNEGRGLALRFASAGVSVVIGSRDASRAADVAASLSARVPTASISGTDNGSAIAQADVVVLAVAFAHAADTVVAHRDAFREGALVLDVTVPLVFEAGKPRHVELAEGSSAEQLRALLPPHVRLACAFKTLPAWLLEHVDEPLDCDDFICGDSRESREAAAAIVGRIPGLRPVDAGPLDSARTLERMTLLAVRLNKRYKSHRTRFKVLGI